MDDATETRTCPRCNRRVKLDDWYKSRCKSCYNEYRRNRYATDPAYRQKMVEKARAYREKGPQG